MKIYVGNLPFSVTSQSLREHFEPFGEVEDAAVVTDRDTGRSRGFGFVTMPADEAAKAAIEALNSLNGSRRVVLHTDSKYVMDGITDWMPNWKKRGWKTAARKPVKNQDLWQALDAAASRHDIDWRWVKGHDGNPGNEEADALANRGIDELN